MSKTDLHIYTNFNGGENPDELIKKIADAGVVTFAVTDRGTICGMEALAGKVPEGMRMITGAEFSCAADFGGVTVAGYAFDPDSDAIKGILGEKQLTVKDVTSAIRAAGGMAIWTDPLCAGTGKCIAEEEFIDRFWVMKAAGIQGIECWYSKYDAEQTNYLKSVAGIHNMFVTGGSGYRFQEDVVPGTLNSMAGDIDDEEITALERI